MPKIKPLGNRVLIKRAKAQTTKGGILLPDSAQEKPKEGVVIEAGPGKLNDQGVREPLNVKVGDKILYSTYAATEVKNLNTSEDEELLILSEDDILAIIN